MQKANSVIITRSETPNGRKVWYLTMDGDTSRYILSPESEASINNTLEKFKDALERLAKR
tara:strand:+ start:7220 stop:7399 length:180 start_codon:yes stop_codon:yes gene_type:complete